MKSLKATYLALVFSILFFYSCNQDPEIRGEDIPYSITFGERLKPENDFVWRALNSWYYWQKDVPNLRDDFRNSKEYPSFINFKKTDVLFHELLYHDLDRNSWITNNGIVQRVASNGTMATVSTGFDFTVLKDKANRMIALVNYVVDNTSAKNAGMKRGDVIVKVNGNLLNNNNTRQLNGTQISISVAENVQVEDSKIKYSGEKTYTLTASAINENYIFPNLLNVESKKIAYMVYNSFTSSSRNLNYYFGEFKSRGAKELILDLRYNSGGYVDTSVALAQMITGNYTGQPFVKLEFNEKHQNENTTLNMKDYISVGGSTEKINSLGLNRVFILTSGGTASASEIVIKCLKPYINVITIGGTTYGKYVGSHTLYDSPNDNFIDNSRRNPSHNWSIQPITFAYYDKYKSHTDLNKGMEPDYKIPYIDYVGNLDEFSNPNTRDPAIRKALELITGKQTFSRLKRSATNDLKFVASRKTMMPFEPEAYIELK